MTVSSSVTVPPSMPLPATGVLRGRTHFLPVRVYYEDTDAGGIVYHANYLRFAERARTEMLRAVGINLIKLRDEQGLIFVVHKGEIAYKRSAKLDDMLVVESDLEAVSGASVTIRQTIQRVDEDGKLGDALAVFRAYVACIETSGRLARFPKDLRARMESLTRPSPAADTAAASNTK